MKPERLHYLILRYIKNTCSREELNELLSFIEEDQNQHLLHHEMKQYWDRLEASGTDKKKWDKRFYAMMKKTGTESVLLQTHVKKKQKRHWVLAAAMITLIVSSGYFWFSHNASKPGGNELATPVKSSQRLTNDVPPGGNKAVLTLANGKKIILDSASNGALATQGNTKVLKVRGGQIAYNTYKDRKHKKIIYNTIETPRGGQYELILADGSKVWLNAASSLKFPSAFNGKERKVTLTGEAYFEIATNKNKPFKVEINNAEVEVLGTHFNIMAYDNEKAVKTTLLEGSVRISNGDQAAILQPGEQARMDKNSTDIQINKTNIEEVTAWKRGYFQFNNSNLKVIMRQIMRWYDVEIRFPDNMPTRIFTGKIPRNVSLKHVLKVLELSNVHFKLKGKTIVLTPVEK